MAKDEHIVVLGAGVTGLTTALQLLRSGYTNVSVVAKHMPADYDNSDNEPLLSVSKKGTSAQEWDIDTWKELYKLALEVPAAGVWLQEKTSYFRNQDVPEGQVYDWFKDLLPEYRILSKPEVPPFADWAIQCRTVSLDPSIYLHYLQSQCLSLGASFRRVTLSHIREAFTAHSTLSSPRKAELVINCSGLLACQLGGVEDKSVIPLQGQLVVVSNESGGMFSISGADDIDKKQGETCYIINRPSGGGTALGGSSRHSWSGEPDPELAKRIMGWAIRICPRLVPPEAGIEALDVIRHEVVHSYGASGFGYQSSYGMANTVVTLVQEFLNPA